MTETLDAQTDLHCHSTASDGRLSPTQLVEHACAAGIHTLALTDHDTLSGLDEARDAACSAGIRFINGVELSVSWEGKTLHIVGLGIDTQSAPLVALINRVQNTRHERAKTMAARIEKLGVVNAAERVVALAGGGQVTRTHFARLLVEDGVAEDLNKAFKKYLGAGKPAQVRGEWLPLDETVMAIHRAGGLSVLAHPLRYKFSGAWRERMLKAFKSAGGRALEVSAGASQQPDDIHCMATAARKYGLLASIGSDFHEPDQRWLRYGRLSPIPSGLPHVLQELN